MYLCGVISDVYMSIMAEIQNLRDVVPEDAEMKVPSGGKWVDAQPAEFQSKARNMACGLMVKGIRRGAAVSILNASAAAVAFISFACALAHLQVKPASENNAGFVIDAAAGDVDYLVGIGSAWSGKYGYLVDRTLRQMVSGSSTPYHLTTLSR